MALILVMVFTAGRLLMKPCKVFNTNHYSTAAILDQLVQHLRVFKVLVLVMERLEFGLKSDPDLSWLFRQSQHIFFSILEILRYAMIMERMVNSGGHFASSVS